MHQDLAEPEPEHGVRPPVWKQFGMVGNRNRAAMPMIDELGPSAFDPRTGVSGQKLVQHEFHAKPLGNAFGEYGAPTLDRGDSAPIRTEFTDFAQELRISVLGQIQFRRPAKIPWIGVE
jgi:hypothetical protein